MFGDNFIQKTYTDEMIPCYTQVGKDKITEDEKLIKSAFWAGGELSMDVQLNITPLTKENEK